MTVEGPSFIRDDYEENKGKEPEGASLQISRAGRNARNIISFRGTNSEMLLLAKSLWTTMSA